ncbi:unnamed protein product [Angiostrongylus costaricensis]|uniref:Protein kinase domain-containing protein n=1 Tax=Angiostrongylus costaricensis TaxID=334426 RepID=A0A3P7H6T9_ANGCS|nr:unnamed protein product [Angiostrongylus costaricensis]
MCNSACAFAGSELDFSNLQEIGRGGFGIVYAATQPNGERVALKKVLEGFAQFFFLKLVFFYEDFVEGTDTYVVMELCELGSMRSHVKKNGPLTDRAAAYVLRQIISAVKYMHREGVLHRDISCGNVLISRIFSSEKISVVSVLVIFQLKHITVARRVFSEALNRLYCSRYSWVYCAVSSIRFDGLGISAVELIESMMETDVSKRISLNGSLTS